ncbi:MAG: flavodoxin family protein [Clostridiales bacterium]|nr:flavodoxin family protein [Candidatus Crickella equi]
MKILVLNGSPRKGNTLTAITAFADAAQINNEVEVVDTYKLNIGPCMGCDACGCTNGCVATDDTNMIIDKMVAADMIVFASPVYWWGITAQMKLVIDKAYCKGAHLTNKKVGIIIIGGASVDSEQYQLIRGQFGCIAEYLNWDILFHRDYSASARDDLAKNTKAIEELKSLL